MKEIVFDEIKASEIRFQRANSPEAQARIRTAHIIQVFKVFSRGIYNRNNMMETRLQTAMLSGQPIQIVGFWGVGEKRSPDMIDNLLLDEYRIIKKLAEMTILNDVEVILILADVHGRFNGYKDFEGYLTCTRVSHLVFW